MQSLVGWIERRRNPSQRMTFAVGDDGFRCRSTHPTVFLRQYAWARSQSGLIWENAMTLLRRDFLRLAAGATLSVLPRITYAQAYPARPVRMIVPFAPGGQN